ncbi:MAG TPA: hypothetical protein VK988_19085, partial [Acidimicrobiales bacterium]|nr:hypothetical protein [Acidimicrobiales bacterium]
GSAAPPPPQSRSRLEPVAASPSLAQSAGSTAKDFSPALVLTGLVVVFLLLQTLFDRRDPKLAAAPMVDELYPFR